MMLGSAVAIDHPPAAHGDPRCRLARSAGPWVVGLLFLACFVPASSAVLTRGPYLQLGTTTSAVIRWSTSELGASWVLYGDAAGSLDQWVCDLDPKTIHSLAIQGLVPATRYYYAVATSATAVLAGDDAEHFFVTPPPAGAVAPTRIWAIGDSGTADGNAAAVRDAYLAFTGSQPTDVWLMLGDNAYWWGTDAEYQAAVFDMYPSLLRNTFLWPAFGNHDALSADSASQSGPYFDVFTLPTAGEAGGLPSGTEAYYSFDRANVHFICLDSAAGDWSSEGAMMQWLAADLATTDQRWIVAYFHHPPYTKGSHDSDSPSDSGGRLFDVREIAVPILEAGGVDLVLSGHSHSYERSFLLDGHYGTSDTLLPEMILDPGDGRPTGSGPYRKPHLPHRGAVYVVAGSSGKLGGGSLDHPVMYFSLNQLGSLVIDVAGDRLDATLVTSSGETPDGFRLLKVLFADGFESGDLSAWSSARP